MVAVWGGCSGVSDPDWVARGIAGTSLALSAGAFYFGRYDGRWKRRHAALQPLRPILESLRVPVDNPGDQVQLRSLFTLTTGAELEQLEAAVDQIPDWKLRPRLRSLVSNLSAVRSGGQQQPAGTAPLTPIQVKRLTVARGELDWVLARMDKAAQRGVV